MQDLLGAAKAALEILGRWQCSEGKADAASGIKVDYIDATKGGGLERKSHLRVVAVAKPDDVNLDAWREYSQAERGDEPRPTLVILARDKMVRDRLTMQLKLRGDADIRVMTWPELRDGEFRGLGKTREHYNELLKGYKENEGEDPKYIPILAVDEAHGERRDLFEWVAASVDDGEYDAMFLVSEYGEGKTSFCLNHVFNWNENQHPDRPIPLLFLLNDCTAGSLEAFVLEQLRRHYRLDVSDLEEVHRLHRAGVILPIFDAFDQISTRQEGRRVELDFATILAFAENDRPMFVTCRRGFFDQHIRRKWRNFAAGNPKARELSLQGFDETKLGSMLEGHPDLLTLLSAPENEATLAGLQTKPLFIHTMMAHEAEFIEYFEKQKTAEKQVTTYGLFDLLFKQWLRSDFKALTDGRAAAFVQELARVAGIDGVNSPITIDNVKSANALSGLGMKEVDDAEILEDLQKLPLLDRFRLHAKPALLTFRFNIYFEFVVARAVLSHLHHGDSGRHAIIRDMPLSWEIRLFLMRELDDRKHAVPLFNLIDRTRGQDFGKVEYQGGNALSLVLQKIADRDTPADESKRWRQRLDKARFTGAVLRRLDARGHSLQGMVFSECDLEGADFSFAYLRNADFRKARLQDAKFDEPGAVLTAAFVDRRGENSDDWMVAGGTAAGLVMIWSGGQPTRRRKVHYGAVESVTVRQGNQHIVSASMDGAVVELGVGPEAGPRAFPMGVGAIQAMLLVRDDQTLLLASNRPDIKVWSLQSGRMEQPLTLPFAESNAVCSAIAQSANTGRVAVGMSDGRLAVFDKWRDDPVGRVVNGALGGKIRALQFLPGDGDDLILAVTDDNRAHLLDLAGNQRDTPFLGNKVQAVSFAPDAGKLFSLEDDKIYRMSWPGGSDRDVIAEVPQRSEAKILSCSRDGAFLAAGGEELRVWSMGRTGAETIYTEPLRLNCDGMTIEGAEGLDDATRKMLEERIGGGA